jgi:hypothetical protein
VLCLPVGKKEDKKVRFGWKSDVFNLSKKQEKYSGYALSDSSVKDEIQLSWGEALLSVSKA